MFTSGRAKEVSVVIPSRDGAATIVRALDSLVPNAPYIREVIVVWSNSPEDYREFCGREIVRYARHFEIVLLDSGPGSNGSIARNAGIKAARGAYVAFLDDDDEWMPHKLEAYARALERSACNGDFVLFSQVVSCREDRTGWSLNPLVRYRQEPIADFIFDYKGGASSLLLPTALARRVLWDESLIRHQDYDFCIRLSEAGATFHEVHEPLEYYYQRGSGIEKGRTFDFASRWIVANRARISRRAFVAYAEKELLAVARESGEWRPFLRFLRQQLTPAELAATALRLSWRALRAFVRRLFPRNRAPFQPLRGLR